MHYHHREDEPAGAAAPHKIIPPSQLHRADTTADYYRNICFLHTRLTGDGTVPATGTIINVGDKYGILTCAHAVCQRTTPAYAPTYTIGMPGLTPGRLSNAIALEADAIRISPDYQGLKPDPNDLAVIRLTEAQLPAGSETYATIETLRVDEFTRVEVPGYPKLPPKPGDATPALYYSRGAGYQVEGEPAFLRYDASTMEGMSGSGVVFLGQRSGEPNLGAITAVHIFGKAAVGDQKAYNLAVYLDKAKVDWITAQLA